MPDGLNDEVAVEAERCDLADQLGVDGRRGGDGVGLHHRQVPRQVHREPRVLPARRHGHVTVLLEAVCCTLRQLHHLPAMDMYMLHDERTCHNNTAAVS